MYLGIDLGTSELKLLVLAPTGQVLATTAVPLSIQRPHPGWSEQHPDAWWQALETAVQQLRQQADSAWRSIRAIGLSGQMHGAVCLDADGIVLRPAILWNDGRSDAECAALQVAVPDLQRRTGNQAMPGFTAPKLAWMRRHEDALFARVARVLLPKDWLALRLTGEATTDPSDASGTLWLDPATRDWDDTLLAATGLSREQMPRLVDGSAPAGLLRPELAHAWGLDDAVVVAAGAGDNAASAVGIGAVEPGQGFISLGTSGVMFLVTDAHRPNPAQGVHAFCHTLPGRWHQMTVMLSAASALSWLSRLLGRSEAELMRPLEEGAGFDLARAPLFLPYLSGERTPHNDVNARASFIGLDAAHGAVEMTHAVVEGVAFGMAQGLAALRAAGSSVSCLALVGGGARSAYWAQLLADTLGIAIETLEGGATGGALGAARLGALAAGRAPHEVCRSPAVRQRFEPRLSAVLQARQARFEALYPALRELFVG